MLLFVSANDLLTMFVALEVFSLPLYLLCALARRKRLLSQESALKYFLLGAYASAFFLFGVAMIYGFAKAVDFRSIHDAVVATRRTPSLMLIGLALLAIGLLFKIAAAPFHVWTPGCLPGRADPGHRLHGRVHQGRRLRWAASRALRRLRRGRLGVHPGARRGGGADHAGRRDPGGHPDRPQAPARLLVDRQRRLHAGRCARRRQGRAVQHAVLPCGVRLHGDRRVRADHAGARRRR